MRRFVREEIVPLEAGLDPDASELDPADHARLAGTVREMGLYGLDVPQEYGGPGVDIVTRTLMAIEMAQHRAGLYAPCYGVFGAVGLAQLYEATEAQKERYLRPTLRGEKRAFFGLTEPSEGATRPRHPDPCGARRRRLGRQRLEDLHLGGGPRGLRDRLRPHRPRAGAGPGVTCFIVETGWPGFHVRRVVHTLRSANYATELQFEDLRVPAANVLGEGRGRVRDRERPALAAAHSVCGGLHRGGDRRPGDGHRVRAPARDLRGAARHPPVRPEHDHRQPGGYRVRALADPRRGREGASRGAVPEGAAMAKLVASEAGGRVVDRAIQIHGGYGVTKDLPLERWYREMRIRRIGEVRARSNGLSSPATLSEGRSTRRVRVRRPAPRTARSGLASPERTLLAASNQEHGNRPERPATRPRESPGERIQADHPARSSSQIIQGETT